MFQGALHIWSIRGIPIRIHFTWLLIFGLLSWSLASGYFPSHYPDLPVAAYWLKGIIAALFLFGSILVHELMHAITAQKLQVPIAGITLFALGGVAEMQEEPPAPAPSSRLPLWVHSPALCWPVCSGCCGRPWPQRAAR
jgi:Zn-dependent protease